MLPIVEDNVLKSFYKIELSTLLFPFNLYKKKKEKLKSVSVLISEKKTDVLFDTNCNVLFTLYTRILSV